MAETRELIEEIKGLLSSKKDKASAYPKLLHLQEISVADSSSVQTLAESSRPIIASLVRDIFDNDEEISAQALKCLGFMIYHPTVVASIRGDDASIIIESLVKVIVTTKIKSVCNLGIWCITIQQFSVSLLDQHIESLIRAIIHGLDNPIGSLSTTFEAMQAVMKLVGSMSEKLRNMSSLWVPPIYRRLVSMDKRDRDMSERCLLKIMPILCPPPVTLSKVLAVDLKKKLLFDMKNLLDQGSKIQTLQAWGWFIRLLGPYATKSKHVVNEMLKILETMFSDTDSQVQIASLVSWEGLIDALNPPQAQGCHLNVTLPNEVEALRTSDCHSSHYEVEKHLKIIKLMMAPLLGIMSSKCDVSVHASCLSTWSYLLHKLNDSACCQTVLENVWEPIIKEVFRVGPDKKHIWFFNFCLDLIDALILGRGQETSKLNDQETSQLSLKSAVGVRLSSGKGPLKHYPINFTPWKLSQMDFFIRLISILVNQESSGTVDSEFQRLANDAALRLFGSLLEAVQRALKSVSINYDEVMQCLNTIFRFLGNICKHVMSEDSNYCTHEYIKFLDVVTDKLEPSILESPLYKVGLDLELIKNLTLDDLIRSETMLDICLMDSENRVLPVVYLSILYFSVVVRSSSEEPKQELLLQQMKGFVKNLLSSYCSEEVLRVYTGLLYKNTTSNCLKIWVVLANCFKDGIDSKALKLPTDKNGHSHLLHLLSYPFTSWSCASVSLEPQMVVEAWKSLYMSINQALEALHGFMSFSEDLCAMLTGYLDQIKPADARTELQLEEKNAVESVLIYGGVTICILEQLSVNMSSKGKQNVEFDSRKFTISNHMELAARIMKLLWDNKERTKPSFVSVAPRFLSELVKFVGHLHQSEHMVVLIQTTASSLFQWVSNMYLLDGQTNHQLQILWTEILKRLSQSLPTAKFDSSFLKLQGPLLGRTLDHPNPAISEPTINFWNSTYGTQIKLEFPQNLLPVLDKLSRNGKINLFTRSHLVEENTSQYKVTTTLKKCSKRVELVGNTSNGSQGVDKLCLSAKRKRIELTEHQKEVRRAQQGRTWDCSGHGPGFRTYTTADFSQGNEESQESQDIRDAESILELLRKV